MLYTIIILGSFILSLVLVPAAKFLSARLGAVDVPQDVKIHKTAVSRLGGPAIVIAFALPLLFFAGTRVYAFAAILACALGLVDDIKNIPPQAKLTGEIILAVILFSLGFALEFNPLSLSLMITILWLVGISNAVNLIDGLDGLAAGTAAISAAFFAVIAYMVGDNTILIVSLALIGALVGFLRYNFHPASIFMGDSGSLSIGFIFGIIGVSLADKVGYVIPLIILALPILDTLYAVIRRGINRKPIFRADLGHIYNTLMTRFGHTEAVFICYLAAAMSGLLGLAVFLVV